MKFRNIFSEMAQNKIILLSTHIVEDVQAVCSRVLVIYDGRILYDGSPSELIQETAGHVGIYLSADGQTVFDGCQMVSKVNVSDGIQCRVVAQELPECAKTAEPTLEDAYLYCIHRKGGRQ